MHVLMETADRNSLIFLAILFWGFRLLVLIQVSDTPLAYLHTWKEGDMNYFHETALRISSGDLLLRDPPRPVHEWMNRIAPPEQWNDWYGNRQTFFMEPGYAYLLGFLYALLGSSPAIWVLIQQSFSFLLLLMLYRLTLNLVGRPAAVTAALFFSLYGPLMMYETILLRESFLSFGLFSVLYFTWFKKKAFLSGLIMGGLMIIKSVTVVGLPFFLATLLKSGRAGKRIMLFLSGVILAITPVIVRNAAVSAPLTSLSTRAPVAFYVGNHVSFPGILADSTGMEKKADIFRNIVERHGYHLYPVIRSSIASHPTTFHYLGFCAKKIRYMLLSYEAWNNVNFYFFRELIFPLRITLSWGVLLCLGLASIGYLKARWQFFLPAGGIAAIVLSHALLTSVLARYRQPMVPILCILAGIGSVEAWKFLKQKNFRLFVFFLSAVLVLFFLFRGKPGPELRRADFGIYESINLPSGEIYRHPGYQTLKKRLADNAE